MRQFGEKINCYTVKYAKADNNWETVEEDIYPYGKLELPYDIKKDLNLWGVTNHAQAVKIARYMLASNELRREEYTLTLPIEHFALSKGQRVLLSNDVISIGIANGFIKSYNPATGIITIDELLGQLDPDKAYSIKIQTGSGVDTYQVSQPLYPSTQLQIVGDYPPTIAVRSYYAFGVSGIETFDCIIKSRQPQQSPNLSAKITLLPYAPDIFDAESKEIPPFLPNITTTDFDLSLVNNGQASIPEDIIEITVKDDGIVFFDFETPDRKDNGDLYNYGSSKTFGDGEVVGTLDFDDGPERSKGYVWCGSSSGGYIKVNPDTTFYGTFSISFWFKRVKTGNSNNLIFDFYDPIKKCYLSLILDRYISLRIQGIAYNSDYKTPEIGHLVIVKSLERSIIEIYLDGVLVYSQFYSSEFDDEGIISNYSEFDDEGIIGNIQTVDDDEGMASELILGKAHDKTLYVFSNPDQTHLNKEFQIARLRIFPHDIMPNDAFSLYKRDAYYANTPAIPRFLGAFETAPVTGFLYEIFLYIGPTSDDFIHNKYYTRTVSGWEYCEPESQSVPTN
jgi:hypothetical protein